VLGFSFVEIGSVTPLAQEGNPRTRVFRLVEDQGVINRYGFNSDGAVAVRSRLISYRNSHVPTHGFLGINLGKNKNTPIASDDYVKAMQAIGAFGDYLVINISSPNTPGLRSLQAVSEMEELITKIQEEKQKDEKLKNKPLLVKIAPDLSSQELHDLAQVSLRTKVDGLIVSNTTTTRPQDLKSPYASQIGGLSGRPLKERSLEVLKEIHSLTEGKIKLISVGGIENGEDVYERLQAGASLVQLYTAMTFEGPGIVSRINDELDSILEKNGIDNISQITERKL
jgi:dihydroorotate dehydrogenase